MNSNAFKKNAKAYGKERGSILLLSLPLFLAASLLLFGAASNALYAQKKVALQARLDICASTWAQQRALLLRTLADKNQKIEQLSKAVVALRLAQPLMGPLGALAKQMGEEGLKKALLSLELGQKLSLMKQQIWEGKNMWCEKRQYSKEIALCTAEPFITHRHPGLMPDLPGALFLKKLPTVTCNSLSTNAPKTKLQLSGDPNLRKPDQNYVYLL